MVSPVGDHKIESIGVVPKGVMVTSIAPSQTPGNEVLVLETNEIVGALLFESGVTNVSTQPAESVIAT